MAGLENLDVSHGLRYSTEFCVENSTCKNCERGPGPILWCDTFAQKARVGCIPKEHLGNCKWQIHPIPQDSFCFPSRVSSHSRVSSELPDDFFSSSTLFLYPWSSLGNHLDHLLFLIHFLTRSSSRHIHDVISKCMLHAETLPSVFSILMLSLRSAHKEPRYQASLIQYISNSISIYTSVPRYPFLTGISVLFIILLRLDYWLFA